ncbi:MAG: hypothetical protein COA69_13555 [Robiginitomaculum sp.]|nr:MAG: hypothetical protein COA69_13555 [Robiginitomaculum sp.]
MSGLPKRGSKLEVSQNRRIEPADSPQLFATPPWATRVLLKYVLPGLIGNDPITPWRPETSKIWEPACGGGHMAQVLRDEGYSVHATDLHNYGYSDQNSFDFTAPLLNADPAPALSEKDCIFTNPPFGPVLAEFIREVLTYQVSIVAMIFKLEAINSEGREDFYHDLRFRGMGTFAYRPCMVKGGWDPVKTTMTGYAWYVWTPMHNRARRNWEGVHVPYAAHTELTHPDDAKRFAGPGPVLGPLK